MTDRSKGAIPVTLEGRLKSDLEQLLRRGKAISRVNSAPTLVATARVIPRIDTLSLFSYTSNQHRIFWENQNNDISLVALGSVQRITGHGRKRFSQIKDAWTSLCNAAYIDDSYHSVSPIAFAGFAFDGDREREDDWKDYGDALLVVPNFVIGQHRGSSVIILQSIVSPDSHDDVTDFGDLSLFENLISGSMKFGDFHQSTSTDYSTEDSNCDWPKTAAEAIKDINSGSFEKIVLARRQILSSRDAFQVESALNNLRNNYDGCTIFAFDNMKSCFFGATPERLASLENKLVKATCLAGSMPRGTNEEEDQLFAELLLSNTKERHEHDLVVKFLQSTLGLIAGKLEVDKLPSILKMSNVQHLSTLVEGSVSGCHNILEVVDLLHPTPAVGGVPVESALSWIRDHEAFDRGWYSGPIGWIEGNGNGEFAIAIRSGLIIRNKAIMYAGCGLVAESNPDDEYLESCLKMRPVLSALRGGY